MSKSKLELAREKFRADPSPPTANAYANAARKRYRALTITIATAAEICLELENAGFPTASIIVMD